MRPTAEDLLELPPRASAGRPAFEARKAPAWVQRPRETLSALPASGVERLLPGSWGRQRTKARILEEIDQIVRTNVEHLRWATRQNIEESLRHFGSDLDAALGGGLKGAWESLAVARRLREGGASQAEPEQAARLERAKQLQTVAQALTAAPA